MDPSQITTSPILLAFLAAASLCAGIALIKVADSRLTSDTSRLARGVFWWPLAGVGLALMAAPVVLILVLMLRPMLVIDWRQPAEWLPM